MIEMTSIVPLGESREMAAAPNGKHRNVGYFDDESKSLKPEFIRLRRNKAAKKYSGEFHPKCSLFRRPRLFPVQEAVFASDFFLAASGQFGYTMVKETRISVLRSGY